MEKFLIGILPLFKWAYDLAGVNFEQLKAIVSIKLTMDNRRQLIAYRQNQKKESGNTFLMTMIVYGIFGLFVGLLIATVPSIMVSMIIFFGYVMAMISMTLITDFSSTLLDTSDNTIILPRPVDSRTLFAARVTHILLYLGQLTFALSLVPAIFLATVHGVTLLIVFIPLLGLSVLMAMFITNALYLSIMQFASEEKLKNIINYFQIAMAVLIMGGYQLMPRMMDQFDLENQVFEIKWWSYLVPPVWMAGTMEMARELNFQPDHILLLMLAVTVPLTGWYVTNKYLTPQFSKKLSGMDIQSEGSKVTVQKEGGMLTTLTRWLTATRTEAAGFSLVYKILARDRKIKLKIYPAFGYVLIFGAVFVLRNDGGFAEAWRDLPNTSYHLVLIYILFMILQVALYELPYSDDFKASWVYYALPVARPGEILSGMVKAVIVRLFVPAYAVICIAVLAIWGPSASKDLLFGLFNNILMVSILAAISGRHLPLSQAPNTRSQSGNFMRSMLIIILVGILGAGHYLLGRVPWAMLVVMPFQVLGIYAIMHSYKSTTWKKISA